MCVKEYFVIFCSIIMRQCWIELHDAYLYFLLYLRHDFSVANVSTHSSIHSVACYV